MLSCQNAKAEFETTEDLSASQFPLLLLIVNLKLLAGTLIPMMMRWGCSENEGGHLQLFERIPVCTALAHCDFETVGRN